MLTPLASHLLAAVLVSTAFAWSSMVGGFGLLTVVGFGLLAMVAAVFLTPPARDHDKLTTLDRFMINLKRLFRGKNRWLHMGGVMYFDASDLPSRDDAVQCMKELVPVYPRFGSIAVQQPQIDQSYFETVPGGKLDYGYHVVEHACADEAAVKAKCNELINIALDDSKPKWRFDLVANRSTGRAAVLFRVDHCLADGLRLIKAAGGFVKFEDGSPAELAMLKKMSNRKQSTKNKRSMVNLLSQFIKDLPAVLTQDKMKPEDSSCFHASNTLFDPAINQATVTSAVRLSDVKAIRAACPPGTTINDVVLAAFCGALNRYAEKVDEPLSPGALMRAFCAVSMPDTPGRGKEDMYNDFIMASFELPVGHPTSAARLHAVRATMGAVKTSLAGPIATALSSLLGRLGLDTFAGDTQLKIFPLHSFVYSNVPGYEQPVFLFNNKSKITGFEVYYPNVISQVIFLSYCDQLTLSLSTSPTVVQQPALLAQAFVDEVAQWQAEL